MREFFYEITHIGACNACNKPKKVKFVKVRRWGGKLPLVTFDQRDAEEGNTLLCTQLSRDGKQKLMCSR